MQTLRDALTLDVKAIYSKTGQQIESVSRHCLQQFRN